ncbi:MAG: lsrD [Verrucomicrobiales bacterium]|nr:lsrD [Verrucomicrobiales bacterium]
MMQAGAAQSRIKTFFLSQEGILFVVLILEWFYFHSVGPRFGSLENNFDIIRHSVEIGLLAVAMTPIILTGGIDLSVGSLLGLCAIIFGKLWRDAHIGIWGAGGGAILVGALGGSINGVLIARLKLPPLIVTLGTFSLYRGIAEAITHGVDTFTGFPAGFLTLGQEKWLGMPAQLPLFLLIILGMWLTVHRTVLGRSWRAIGFSPEGALYAGIPVRRRLFTAYVLAGVIAGVASIIYTSRLGQAKADAGTGYELFAITAVVLGGTSIFGGLGSVHGTLLGVGAIAILGNGLVHARQPREVTGMLTGLLLILALAVPILSKRLLSGRSRKKMDPEPN